VSTAGVGAGVEADLTATHFSFPSSTTILEFTDFSVSSSVSASTPVVVSDSEELEDDEDDVTAEVVVSVTTVAAGVSSVDDEVEVATEESLFAAASFLACLTRSFLSNF
jgi:hypothetical protein